MSVLTKLTNLAKKATIKTSKGAKTMAKKTTNVVNDLKQGAEQKKQEVITSLTPDQKAQIPVFLERYRAIGLSTEPTDKARAEKAVRDSYDYLKLVKPAIVWADDPFEGAKLAAPFAKFTPKNSPTNFADFEGEIQTAANQFRGNKTTTIDEIKAQANYVCYGSFEAQWVVFYSYIDQVLGVRKDNLIDIVNDIIKDCGLYWTFDGLVVMTPKPKAIHMKDGKLHNTAGLALEYHTGRGIYAVDGVRKANLAEIMLAEKFESTKPAAGKGKKAS